MDFLPAFGIMLRTRNSRTRRPRRNRSLAFNAKTALAAVKGEKTLAELAAQFDVHTYVIKTWRDHLPEGASGMFGKGKPEASPPVM
ncbi:MAG: hypothetical protein ING08_05610 [Roseomonas sp.]|nr:hypothetical protein [Roseomonas sp.]MCA3379704.1 hypothetical protein [Roseomonas sp.]